LYVVSTVTYFPTAYPYRVTRIIGIPFIHVTRLLIKGNKLLDLKVKYYNIIFMGMEINPLNDELNYICHLLVLLGDSTFMGPCIISIFQYTCISNNMQRYIVYLYLETALHVSGGTSTHHQERIQLYLQHLVFFTPLLLSAAIVEELEPV
jgi:hypothetical protein